MAHRLSDEAGAASRVALVISGMTPAERAQGRYMRAPDHEAGGEAVDPLRRIAASLGEGDDEEIPTGEGDEPAGDEIQDEGEELEPSETDETADEPGSTAIKPPVSWDNDAKELFAQLPPELQSKVAEREAQREKLIQTRTTEAAEAKRNAFVEANTALAAERHQHAQAFEQLAAQFTLPPEPDPALFQHGEAGAQRFYEMKAERETAVAQQQHMLQQAAAARGEAAQREQASRQHVIAQNDRALADALGDDWTDQTKRQTLLTGLEGVGAELGYPSELMGQADATDILALHRAAGWKAKAEKYDALQKQKMTVVRQAKELPRSTRPGAPQPPGSAQARSTQQHRDRLKSSGDPKDAAALIALRL